MKIEFKTPADTGTAVTIAASTDYIDGYDVEPGRNVDTFTPCGGGASKFKDRGCENNSVAFVVYKQHATPAAAIQYINELSANTPTGTGTLIVTTQEGATPVAQYLINAVIMRPKSKPIGCSTITSYIIRGGTFQSTNPNP